MIENISKLVNDITNNLPEELKEDEFKGLRTLDAHRDIIRIGCLVKKFPGETDQQIAQRHVDSCLWRDYHYKFEKIWY